MPRSNIIMRKLKKKIEWFTAQSFDRKFTFSCLSLTFYRNPFNGFDFPEI